nr:unnamed protein product [Digitaria exilis]
MYSSYSAAAFALRAAKPSLHGHSSYAYSYLPYQHCHRDDADEHHLHHQHHELLQQSPYLTPRFLLDGCLLRHSAHLLLLSARLRPPPPTHSHPPRCCRRRAAARCCCVVGGERPVAGQVSWQVEARGCRCCGRGAARSDLGSVCRRLEAAGCRCGGSGGGKLLRAGVGRRDAPRLVGRAVRQEVWEYEGGQWPRRCLMECHDDWEDQEDCDRGQLEVVRLVRRKWEDDADGNDETCRCRDCGRRKGLESYYSGEDGYSGRRRERSDVDDDRSSFRNSDRRRRQQREYYGDEDDLDLRRRRQTWEGRDRRHSEFDDAVDTRRFETRRYRDRDDGREYDHRRERRDFSSDDLADVRRTGRYAEDVGRFDWRRESRDLEIDDKVDVRREGMRRSSDDQRYVSRHQRRSEDTDGEDVSLLRSHRSKDEEIDYDEQDLAERRYYSGVRSQKSGRALSLHQDDSNRASSSRCKVDAGHTRQEENLSSRVRWRDNVDRQTEQASKERDRRHSVGWSNDERDTYEYDDARFVRIRDSRAGTQDVKVITEDDTRFASSSKNTSILKHGINVDQEAAVHKDESRKSSQKIMEISEVQDNCTERDSRAQSYHQEGRGNYTENKSSSIQNSVKVASDSRRQVDQHNAVNQNLISLTESRKNTENLVNVTTDSNRNVSRASYSQRNFDEVNQADIDNRSTFLQNIIHVTRDKKRIVNQQLIHETDIDVQNITHVDVSKIRASDTSTSRTQSHLETKSDMNSTSSMNFLNNTRNQEKDVRQNKISASDTAMFRGSQSHLETEVYGQFDSTSSANIADSTKGSQEKFEVNIANASNLAASSTSVGHLQTRIDGRFQSTSAVNTFDSIKEQVDLAKIPTSDATGVSSSQGLVTKNGNQVDRTSAVHWPREKQGKNDQKITQVCGTEQNDEVRSKFSESFQDSGGSMVRSKDTHHNMDLIWQKADTSGISDGKDITGLLLESTEEGSSMAQGARIMGSNEQEVRSETTAETILQSGSSGVHSVKESMLESAARLEKSSTFHVGRFVDEIQKGVSYADTSSTKKNEKSIVEGTTWSSSRSRMKGPADEMWDVHSTTSQETFKTADKEEGSSADGATNSASQTPKNESAVARKVHKSLWAYVADIVRLGWIQRGDSHDSSDKPVKKSSSSNSQSTEGWLSSQERDNDGIRKKNKAKDQVLIKSHSGESEPGVASMSKEEYFHTGTEDLQISDVIEPQVVRSQEDLLARRSKDDPNISGERIKKSDEGQSPKGNIVDDSTLTLVDAAIGHLPKHKTATSSRITSKDSSEFNTAKGMLADSSSVAISAIEAGHKGDGADWIYDPSGAITSYHHPQMQTVMPHENTSTSILEPPSLPVGGTRFGEKNVVLEPPEVIKTGGQDAELKRRMFQRNKQVLKGTFDEWEEAYQRDAMQRKADELFMREALLEAQRAADIWEVPIGAVLVQNGEIIARGCNLVEDLRDSTAHAEIVCIREASNKLKTWRLADTTLYVTLEPCAMCAGAILQARIDTVVWGAPNKLLGADGSWVRLFPGDAQTSTLDSANQSQATGPIHPFHPKITIRRGVLSAECSEIMQQFFQLRRRKKQKPQSPPRAHQQGHHHPVKFFSKMHHMFGTIFCL